MELNWADLSTGDAHYSPHNRVSPFSLLKLCIMHYVENLPHRVSILATQFTDIRDATYVKISYSTYVATELRGGKP